MAVSWQQLLHNTALRMNALVGESVADITATYDTATLTAVHFKSADWPLNSFRDALIMAVEDFAWAIADTGEHPWRGLIGGITLEIPNNGVLPTVSSIGKQIIGVWGAVFDAADNHLLDPLDLDVVRLLSQETWRTYPLYYFAFYSQRIAHTRTNVRIECCVFSRGDALAQWEAGGASIILPDVLEMGITARAISIMTKDSAFADQAAVYRIYSDEALARIRAGMTTASGQVLPEVGK